MKFFITGLHRDSHLLSSIGEKYKSTLHIDAYSVLWMNKAARGFKDYELDSSKEWAPAVIDTIKRMEAEYV